MLKKYCAFLRGVNVNGITIKMNDLKAAFTEMGFLDVKTILATGNVIFSAEAAASEHELKSRIESGLSNYFHYEAYVFVLGEKAIQDIVTAARNNTVPDGYHHYSLLFDEEKLSIKLKVLFDSIPKIQQEQFIPHPYGAFWIVPKGSTLDSEFGSKVLGSRQYKSLLTSRNLNTIEKIACAISDQN